MAEERWDHLLGLSYGGSMLKDQIRKTILKPQRILLRKMNCSMCWSCMQTKDRAGGRFFGGGFGRGPYGRFKCADCIKEKAVAP
jgi:hypothetical protein